MSRFSAFSQSKRQCFRDLLRLGTSLEDPRCGNRAVDISSGSTSLGFAQHATIGLQRDVAWRMIKAGVRLARGGAYGSEEPGWLRLALRAGTGVNLGPRKSGEEELQGFLGNIVWTTLNCRLALDLESVHTVRDQYQI